MAELKELKATDSSYKAFKNLDNWLGTYLNNLNMHFPWFPSTFCSYVQNMTHFKCIRVINSMMAKPMPTVMLTTVGHWTALLVWIIVFVPFAASHSSVNYVLGDYCRPPKILENLIGLAMPHSQTSRSWRPRAEHATFICLGLRLKKHAERTFGFLSRNHLWTQFMRCTSILLRTGWTFPIPLLWLILHLSGKCYPRITGHCFHIEGTTFYLVSGVPPNMVKKFGHWHSHAFLEYWHCLDYLGALHIEMLPLDLGTWKWSVRSLPKAFLSHSTLITCS